MSNAKFDDNKLEKLLKKCNELSKKIEEEIIKKIKEDKNEILNDNYDNTDINENKDVVVISMKIEKILTKQ